MGSQVYNAKVHPKLLKSNITESPKEPGRWRMLALLWLVYASFGMTIGTLPPLVPLILVDLNMTNTQMGLVLGAWQMMFIITSWPLGKMVDKYGARNAIAGGLVIIWLSLILRGLSNDFPTLFVTVALFGVGGPIISVGSPKVVSQWFKGRERGIAAGIYASGAMAGTVFGLATAASVALSIGSSWRGISLIYGIPVLAVIFVWLVFGRESQDGRRAGASTLGNPSEAGPGILLILLRERNVQLILLVGFLVFFLNHSINSWLPTLLQEKGMTITQAGAWAAVAMGAGLIGQLGVPSLISHGKRVPAMAMVVIFSSVTTVGLVVLDGPGLMTILIISGIVRTPMMVMLTLMLMETREVGSRRMGAAGGLFFAISEIGGFGGPFLVGVLRDRTGDLSLSVFILAAIIAVSFPFVLLIRERK
jgi:CP family cyanate transporter-like MFS transporter